MRSDTGSYAPTCGRFIVRHSPASRTKVVPGRCDSRNRAEQRTRKAVRIREAGSLSRPPIFLESRLPRQRHVLVAARAFDEMANRREREVITGHQHAIGSGTIK